MSVSTEENAGLYLQATEEYENGSAEKALLAKAMALARGDTSVAKYEYIEMRVAHLAAESAKHEEENEVKIDSSPRTGSEQSQKVSKMESGNGWLRQLVNGDLGLARTYWLYGILILNLVFLVPVLLFQEGRVVASQISALACFAFSGAILLGIWRAATKYEGPKVWSIMAQLATVLGWIQIFSLMSLFFGG